MDVLIDQIFKLKYETLSILSALTVGFLIYRYKYKKNPLILSLHERLDDKIVIITGANSGLGYETALDLAKRGALVILACRDLNKAEASRKLIIKKSKNQKIFIEELELSSLDSVKQFSDRINEKYSKIDILINNAGVMSCPKWTTNDGFEYQFQINYLGHYLLTRLLLDCLSKSQEARVINLISKLYESGSINWDDINLDHSYNPSKSYKQSKLCNILFTNELQDYLDEKSIGNVKVYSVSPGVVLTNLGRYFFMNKPWFYKLLAFIFYPIVWFLFKTPNQGAQCTIYCAVKSHLEPMKGFYFRDCKQIGLLPHAFNKEDSHRLWNLSENFVKKWL